MIVLPPIALIIPALFAILHMLLAFLTFTTILGHVSAALFDAWIRRDGVFHSMQPWARAADRRG